MGASRIDRIYTTKELSDKKIGVETVAAAFTEHLSVVMRLSVDVPIVRSCKEGKLTIPFLARRLLKRGCTRRGQFGGSREGSIDFAEAEETRGLGPNLH